ncbi:TIGR03749 family integrating conjugative element protein [Thioalkalivibrio sp. ALJ2]|uniref:TIGR03749 family integrating conjugative element protein n=1 Tax=Thioalkalivibrio sp. ALJ2 TaxID=1261622 RepID=UPI0003804830|nr:TIGR03749 family integrating conjugative element protein [Thioalkalivibrio sp. ALJ2]
MRPILAIALIAALSGPVSAIAGDSPDRITWDGTPVQVTLPVGQERMIRFPAGHVRVGLPPHIDDQVRVFSNDGIVYLKAQSSFGSARAVIADVESGATFMLDLSAEEGARANEVVIHRPGSRRDHATDAPDSEPDHQNLDYVALTRFAAQSLYGPSRLAPQMPGVRQVSLNQEPVRLVRGAAVTAEPLAAWRGGRWYVTAVKLRNATESPVTLDPRDLRGDWLTATFQHARLHPAGHEADTTAVYVVSDRPFDESFWGVR